MLLFSSINPQPLSLNSGKKNLGLQTILTVTHNTDQDSSMCFSGLKMNDIVNHFVLEAGCIKRNHTAIQYIIYVSIIITINGIILSVTTVQSYKKIITFFFFFS